MKTALKQRWGDLCAAHDQSDADATWSLIEGHYSESQRAYHNLNHVAACLDHLDRVRSIAKDPVAMEFALWFHDVIYDTRAKDNEARSADVAVSTLRPPIDPERIRDLILATRHSSEPRNGDSALLCDIDLATLGAEPADYANYRDQIREEYARVPEADYRSGRIAVLRGFLDRPEIYATAPFRHLEARARENLAAEIREWQAR